MPIDEAIDKENEKYLDSVKKTNTNPWATSEGMLNTQERLYKEELEEVMPELAPDPDDKKVHSF